MLPFYESQGITAEHILTKVTLPRTNGFVERFNRTVLDRGIWTDDSIIIITKGPTEAIATWADDPSKRLKRFLLSKS